MEKHTNKPVGVVVKQLQDAPGLQDGDTSEEEDISDDDCPDYWEKTWSAPIQTWRYKKRSPSYNTTNGRNEEIRRGNGIHCDAADHEKEAEQNPIHRRGDFL